MGDDVQTVSSSISAGTTRSDGGVIYTPLVQPSSINETVLEDEATHPAYMEMLRENQRIVGCLALVAMLILGLLSWFGKTVPDAFATVPQWAIIILGVLLVGDALLGKLAVKA